MVLRKALKPLSSAPGEVRERVFSEDFISPNLEAFNVFTRTQGLQKHILPGCLGGRSCWSAQPGLTVPFLWLKVGSWRLNISKDAAPVLKENIWAEQEEERSLGLGTGSHRSRLSRASVVYRPRTLSFMLFFFFKDHVKLLQRRLLNCLLAQAWAPQRQLNFFWGSFLSESLSEILPDRGSLGEAPMGQCLLRQIFPSYFCKPGSAADLHVHSIANPPCLPSWHGPLKTVRLRWDIGQGVICSEAPSVLWVMTRLSVESSCCLSLIFPVWFLIFLGEQQLPMYCVLRKGVVAWIVLGRLSTKHRYGTNDRPKCL